MKEFIDLLKEKGIVDKIQKTVNSVPMPCKDCDDEECSPNRAIQHILFMECERDEELMMTMLDGAVDMFLEAVTKELDIKKDPDAKETSMDEVISSLVATIISKILN